jgi:hypothetical protein
LPFDRLGASALPNVRSLYQAFAQPALAAQPALGAIHPSVVAFVIVAKKMQKPVKREDFQLGQLGMARIACLPLRHTACDDDVP